MGSNFKNHPFAVDAHFESSVVLTFAVPKAEIENMIPSCLMLDTFQQEWAFIAVALVQTRDLRPKGFPKFFGNDFFLIGYRIFVKYINNEGRRLRGLYIIRSETNKKKMELLGNIFTHYKYTTTDILQNKNGGILEISSVRSGFSVSIDTEDKKNIGLPLTSPFSEWKEARRFAGPLPFTFTFLKPENKMLIIEGVRENWIPQPVSILDYSFSFLDNIKLNGIRLASAFIIKEIPYHWHKGKLEQWKQ